MKSTRPEFQMPARPTVSPRGPSKVVAWLRREFVATLGIAGAALTLLAELAYIMPMAPPLAHLPAYWRGLTQSLWEIPLDRVGILIDPTVAAALTIAAFLITIGVGARISAARSGHPLPPLTQQGFWQNDHQTWPSLIAFGSVCLIILLGRDPGSSGNPQVVDSDRPIGWLFAIIGATGYLLGEFFGDQEFHRRLIRTIGAVAVVAAINWLLLAL
jgi:hypothetical protein